MQLLGAQREHEGINVPIRALLEESKGEAYFSPEEVSALAAALDNSLNDLGLVDRNDPTVTILAKRIIELARQGERDPAQLRKYVVDLFQARSRL